MTQPVFPIYRVPEVPYPELVIKSRREVNTRDTVNARNFEHWQTNGKYLVQDRPDLNKQTPFQDFLPISSRMNERNYANQPRYDATGPKLGNNIYFDKYDVAYDNRKRSFAFSPAFKFLPSWSNRKRIGLLFLKWFFNYQ
jgi:hypothetical protein